VDSFIKVIHFCILCPKTFIVRSACNSNAAVYYINADNMPYNRFTETYGHIREYACSGVRL